MFSKHVFSVLIKKVYLVKKKLLILMLMYLFFTYCGSTQCSEPVWGSFIPVHPLFLLQESFKQCYFSLILHIFTGAVGKK